MRKFIAFGPALVVLITVLVTLVAAPAAVRKIAYAATDVQVQLARQELGKDNILKQIDKAVRNIADAVEPSVVHIAVNEPTGRGGWLRSAQGSGWVFDSRGDIVTNAHVVRGANQIMVQFNDGRASDAQIVGQDLNTDVAVIRVTGGGEGFVPVQRASGVEVHQGDRVYAFGSPFGFKFSMSEGIVSGLGRDPRQIMGNVEGYTNFIQTDAAVNPGNSGGPLVNVEGKLVGMNVAIATAPTRQGEGQNSGISFAIPLSTIERVVEQIVNGGVVTRGYLGIKQPFDDEMNQRALNGLSGFHGRGVIITGVEPNTPAAKAGLQAGDVVTKIDKQAVSSVPGLRLAIAGHSPGDKVSVEVWRSGETQTYEVELGRLISDSDRQDAAQAAARFGINDVGETRDGQVLIVEIQPQSAANQAGLRPNMRILDVGGTPVRNLEEFFTALATGLQQGREVGMTVETRGGQRKDIRVPAR